MSEYQSAYVALPAESIPDIRKALSHGLSALVEVIRIRDKGGHAVIPEENAAASLEPIANALLWLDRAEELPKGTPR